MSKNKMPKCSKIRQLFQIDATLKSIEWMLTLITPGTEKDVTDRNDLRDTLNAWRTRLSIKIEKESETWINNE